MINWGIISCCNVTEVNYGPEFSKLSDSRLVAIVPLCHLQRKEELEINKNTLILII
jgi:hypothetical protein